MKKYFKTKTIFTLLELIEIVKINPQLGFYFPINSEHSKQEIKIHNWNNGHKGRRSKTFKRISDNEIIMK